MIRYSVSRKALNDLIDDHAPKWRARSKVLTHQTMGAGAFVGPSTHWSQIKEVYVKLQNSKCIYCETKLKGAQKALIDYDIEHFRPKNKVKAWNGTGNYGFPTGTAGTGYYWLAFEPWNYAASCKPCNSRLKSNFFPIRNRRGRPHATVRQLQAEGAFLCYPLGDVDDNPEDLIAFRGTIAVPAAAHGTFKYARGQVIIDFFELNDFEFLHRERARILFVLGIGLRGLAANPQDSVAGALVDRSVSGKDAFTSCARSLHRLWVTDNSTAQSLIDACCAYIASGEGANPPAF